VLPISGDGECGRNYLDQVKISSFKDESGVVDWDKAFEKFKEG